jgi:predicted ester cyclase
VTPNAVVRAWFKEVQDEGDEDAIDRLMAPDAVAHGLGPDRIRGPDAFKPYVRTMRGALGDLEIEVTQTLTDGDRVVAHCHVVARHAGVLFGAPPPSRQSTAGASRSPAFATPDHRRVELLRFSADVSADGMSEGSAAAR